MSVTSKPLAMDGSQEKQELLRQVDLILGSPGFARSRRLSGFLKYLVNETLEGRGDRIKAFSIAQDVFGRDESFDQQTDAIVRVEAGRLRRRLAEYYLKAGDDYQVYIDIPKGSYAPVISSRADESAAGKVSPPPATGREQVAGKTGESSGRITALASLGAVIVGAALIWWGIRSAPVPEETVPNSAPFIAVLPLVDLGEQDSTGLSVQITDAIVEGLMDLPELRVMAGQSSREISAREYSLAELSRELQLSHVVSGTLTRKQDEIKASIQVTDTVGQEVLWADNFTSTWDQRFSLEEDIAARIPVVLEAHTGADTSGKIYLDYTSSREALQKFREARRLIYPINSGDRNAAARMLFERVIELDPRFAGGYAGLAMTYVYQELFQFGEQTSENVNQALEYARRAVALAPDFGLGQAMLGAAYRIAGRPELALQHARLAVVLQPSDPQLHQNLASTLIWYGHPGEAVASLQEALRLDPLEHRTPYLNILGIAHFNQGSYQQAIEALSQNQQRNGPDGPHMAVYRIAAYSALGLEREARAEARRLGSVPPEFPLERWVKTWSPDMTTSGQVFAAVRQFGILPDTD